MRPINKGESPYKKINEYKDALPYLERRIGMYCSYCEFSIPHVPEVEHVVSKSKGGDLTDWNNLNLGCKYCNTRKKAQTMPENKKNYLWPDEDNTAIAYSYINGIPKVNEELLIKLDSTGDYLKRARNTYNLVGLGNLPMGKDRDRRFGQRNTAYNWHTKSRGKHQVIILIFISKDFLCMILLCFQLLQTFSHMTRNIHLSVTRLCFRSLHHDNCGVIPLFNDFR